MSGYGWLVWAAKRPAGVETTNAYAVLVALAEQADESGSWTLSRAALQDITRLSRTAVGKALRELREAGAVAVISRPGRMSRYTLKRLPERPNPTQVGRDETGSSDDRVATRPGVGRHATGGGSPRDPTGSPRDPDQPTTSPNQPIDQPSTRARRAPKKTPPAVGHERWNPPPPWSDDAVRLAELAIELSSDVPGCRRSVDAWAPAIHVLISEGAQIANRKLRPDGDPPSPEDVERALTALWRVYTPDRNGFDWRDHVVDGRALWRMWRSDANLGAKMLALASRVTDAPQRAFSWSDMPSEARRARAHIVGKIIAGHEPAEEHMKQLQEALTPSQYAWAVEDMRVAVNGKERER